MGHVTPPPPIPAHLERVRHLEVRGLGEEEAGHRAQQTQQTRDQERSLLRPDRLQQRRVEVGGNADK